MLKIAKIAFLILVFQGFLAGEVSYHSENETVILPCQKQSYDDIVWLGPPNLTTYAIEETINKKLSKFNRLSIVHSNINSTYNLKIRYFSIDDEGLYKCVRTVHLPDSQQIYFDLKKTRAPSNLTIENEYSNHTVYGYLNKPINLTCSVVQGIPRGSLFWIANNETLAEAETANIVLSFRPRKRDHLKQLTCTTSKSNFTDVRLQRSVQLIVYMPPRVWISPKRYLYILDEGDDMTIYCNYSSDQKMTYLKWNRLLPMNTQHEINQTTPDLVIQNIKRENAGQYVCTVSNLAGNGSDNVTVQVNYPPKVEVTFTKHNNYRELRCMPNGVPRLYTFKKWEHRTEYRELIRSLPNNGSGVLHLQFIEGETSRHQDRGIYVCNASNNVSLNNNLFTSGEFFLESEGVQPGIYDEFICNHCVDATAGGVLISRGYQQPSSKPYFVTSNNKTQYGLLGNTSYLTVDFVSFPELTNISITPDVMIDSNDNYTLENVKVIDTVYTQSVFVNGSRLTIPVNVETEKYFRQYTIILSNQNGSSNLTVNLLSASRPNKPAIMNVIPKKSQVMLRWDAGFNGGFPQTIIIQYRRRDVQNWNEVLVRDKTMNTYSIDRLTPGTEYLIRMYSRNIKGDSGFSEEIRFTTDAKDNFGFFLLFVPFLIAVAVLYWQYKKGNVRVLERVSCCKWQPFIDAGGIGAVENNFYENQNNEVQNASAQNIDMPVYNSIERRAHLSIGQCVSYSAAQKRKPNPLGKHMIDIACFGASSASGNTAESKCPDELNYIDVCFDPKPSGHKFQIHGSDNKTDYVDIDFSKRICSFAESERNSDDDFSSIDDIRMMRKGQ